MSTYFKPLVIFIIVAALLLKNEAHHCDCHHEKNNKECEEETTTTTTTTPTSTTITKCDPHTCNNTKELYCYCGIDNYPMPESGNCDDLFNILSTTPSYFSELKRDHGLTCDGYAKLCSVTCSCDYEQVVDPTPAPNPTPTPTPTTLCYPQACNNATEPFCLCGNPSIDLAQYSVPESGNCNDLIKLLSTTPSYYYRYGYECFKARTVCKVICSCRKEFVTTPTPNPMSRPTPTPMLV